MASLPNFLVILASICMFESLIRGKQSKAKLNIDIANKTES